MLTSGTEATTAVTNLINACITVLPMVWMMRKGKSMRNRVWGAMFLLFFCICILGMIVHGVAFDAALLEKIWAVLYVVMAYMVAAFVTAILYEIYGASCVKKAVIVNAVLAGAFSILRLIVNARYGAGFAVFLIYCACNLPVVLVLLVLNVKKKLYLGWYLAGVIVLAIGSYLQTVKAIRFHLVWDFDYNAVYHLSLLAFVLLLWKGITAGMHNEDLKVKQSPR